MTLSWWEQGIQSVFASSFCFHQLLFSCKSTDRARDVSSGVLYRSHYGQHSSLPIDQKGPLHDPMSPVRHCVFYWTNSLHLTLPKTGAATGDKVHFYIVSRKAFLPFVSCLTAWPVTPTRAPQVWDPSPPLAAGPIAETHQGQGGKGRGHFVGQQSGTSPIAAGWNARAKHTLPCGGCLAKQRTACNEYSPTGRSFSMQERVKPDRAEPIRQTTTRFSGNGDENSLLRPLLSMVV